MTSVGCVWVCVLVAEAATLTRYWPASRRTDRQRTGALMVELGHIASTARHRATISQAATRKLICDLCVTHGVVRILISILAFSSSSSTLDYDNFIPSSHAERRPTYSDRQSDTTFNRNILQHQNKNQQTANTDRYSLFWRLHSTNYSDHCVEGDWQTGGNETWFHCAATVRRWITTLLFLRQSRRWVDGACYYQRTYITGYYSNCMTAPALCNQYKLIKNYLLLQPRHHVNWRTV